MESIENKMAIIVNEKNFKKEVVESKIPVIIDFFASWCGPCQMMAPVFEVLSGKYKDNLKFVKVNTDEDSQLASKYQVQGIPCLIIVSKGREIDRIVGYMNESSLKSNIDKILGKI